MSDIGPVDAVMTLGGSALTRWAEHHDAEDAALRAALRKAGEALRRINDRLEAVHIDNWKEHDVDWHAIECLRDALAAIEALEVKP